LSYSTSHMSSQLVSFPGCRLRICKRANHLQGVACSKSKEAGCSVVIPTLGRLSRRIANEAITELVRCNRRDGPS
jgi:hypothetical protein